MGRVEEVEVAVGGRRAEQTAEGQRGAAEAAAREKAMQSRRQSGCGFCAAEPPTNLFGNASCIL